jgi:predicted DNA-binding transcriptional regulator AlpA
MDISQLFNKLLDLEKAQQEILRRLDLMVGNSPQTSDPHEEWLDSLEVQKLLKISESTLYRLKKKNILVPARLGSRDYYPADEVRKAINRFMK